MKPRTIAAFAAGIVFGVGLLVSGMTRPSKVIGFLDLAGDWDPSLAFVMGGAVVVHAVAYRLVMRRSAPLVDSQFHVPTRRDIDLPLVFGAAIFGVGWGLGGFCPGPALVAASSRMPSAIVFVVCMTVGMLAARPFLRARTSKGAVPPPDDA